MAAVPQKTLNWLYNVLTREYRDPNRTYSDLAQTLAKYPSLAPRTDVYTFENGTSALLAHFVGTIPVSFRGATYRFPIAIWIPHAYPHEGPLVYVTPTDDMVVRPGQHVAGDGRVYHHYLAHWRDAWDRSNVVDFLSILSDIFAKEPPVMSKQQIMNKQSGSISSGQSPEPPPPRPPLPQDLQLQRPPVQASNPAHNYGGPPPPPPKQPQQNASASALPAPARQGRYDAPPPLPTQASGSSGDQKTIGPSNRNGEYRPLAGSSQDTPQRASNLRQHTDQFPTRSSGGRDEYWGLQPPIQGPSTSNAPPSGYPSQLSYNERKPGFNTQAQQLQQYPQPVIPGPSALPPALQRQQPPPQQLSTKPPPIDLLDSPFDVTVPIASKLPAPPVPRNPEKDAILSAISTALTQTLHGSIAQNNAALSPLQSQHSALASTYQQLEAELANLSSLNATLTSNINILQSSLQKANGAISASEERAKWGDVPKVDEVLTAPTVVGRQLYDVVCEERGIEAGIRALQEGLVRGRIGADIWARKTRELAREGFRKKVLAQKIGRGMGLDGA